MDEVKEIEQPSSLEACFEYFDKKLIDKDEFKNTPERKAVGMCHFSLGMWMRNNWYLWWSEQLAADYKDKGYPQEKPLLVKYFNEELGIFHADDMSSIILTSYHRKLNDLTLRLEEQAKKYQKYWQNMVDNDEISLPSDDE